MEPLDEVHLALRLLGWSGESLRRRLNMKYAHRILSGRARIPPHLLEWLRYLSEPLRQDPPDYETARFRLEDMPMPTGWVLGPTRRQPRL